MFGLFSRTKSIKRTTDKALNKFGQSIERIHAMEKLLNDGSDESLYTLVRRFSFNCHKTIEDEQEKQWVYETLSKQGQAVIVPLCRFIQSNDSITYPLRVLENVVPEDQILTIIDELLEKEPVGYTRHTNKRVQLLDWIGELEMISPQNSTDRIIPYLEDFDESIRFAAVNAIKHRMTPDIEKQLVPPLIQAMTRTSEESLRIKIHIAEILVENNSDLRLHVQQITPLLTDTLQSFKLQHNKLTKKKTH